MKSLVEEASSIAKAIEKAWERAGKPQSFSVKIYEAPEKNFFGFTKKSAKVGIFFEEEAPKKTYDRNQSRPSYQKPQQAPRNDQNIERDSRGQGRFNNRDEDRKTHHASSPSENIGRHEATPRNNDSERTEGRSSDRRPQSSNNNRRPNNRNQDRPYRSNNSRPTDEAQRQPLVSNVAFENPQQEVMQEMPAQQIHNEQIHPQQVATAPISQQQPVVPVNSVGQSQRKVLKVSSRMYTRPKADDSESK